MADPVLRFKVRFSGLKELKARLKRIRKKVEGDLAPGFRQIVTDLLAFVDRRFADSARGNTPAQWKRHSQLTRFVRMHRARKKNRDPKVLVDTGLLRASNLPFIRNKGREFGIENRLPYASLMNFGGRSSASTIAIGSFRRKKPSGGSTRVKGYNMNIRGGKTVPPRPFFPNRRQTIDIVRRNLRDIEKRFAT